MNSKNRIPGPIIEYRDRLVYKQYIPVTFNYAVIDIETTGLNPSENEVIGFGWAHKNLVYGIVRKNMSEYRLKRIIRRNILRVMKKGYKVFAWNKDFEESFLGINGLNELQLYEYEKKDSSLSWGIKVPADGREIPDLWRNKQYTLILLRGVYDALIEAASLPRKALCVSHDALTSNLKSFGWEII